MEYSIELSLDCNADTVIVEGDFNDNQLNLHYRKVKDIMRLYDLNQLINEATNFTEHSQSLMHLILAIIPHLKHIQRLVLLLRTLHVLIVLHMVCLIVRNTLLVVINVTFGLMKRLTMMI